MTEMTRRLLLAGAAAAPFAGWVRLADAATPKDTAVIAKQIDDIITLDPGECYELSGVEICTNIYDRLLRTRPASEDLVLVHGDATFDNILIDPDQNIGFIDCGHAGRGDRYLDLAAITEAIADHFGPAWVGTFGRAYGNVTLDAARLAFFSDLYELF